MTNYDDFRDWRRRSSKYEREMARFTIGDPKDAMIEAEQKAWGDLGDPGLDHYYAGVYFIACGPHIKIGKTGNHPYERMEDFHTGNPYLLELLHVIAIDDEAERRGQERKLHQQFARLRVPSKREWFHADPVLTEFIASSCERQCGPSVMFR